MILGIRTDTSEAELILYDNNNQQDHIKWKSGRQLSEQILQKIDDLINKNKISQQDLKGVVIFEGPGSFTGLRIGFSVANSFAYALQLPIACAGGENWLQDAVNKLQKIYSGPVAPVYGGEANITQPKK